MAKRSLGTLYYPQLSIEWFNGSTGEVCLILETSTHKVKIVMAISCVTTVVDVLREVVNKLRGYALGQWKHYQSLRNYTGYTNEHDTD